ncbi:MAG TPA: spore germination protein GerW family protein [Thermotogota bacterium]|nr:spore germination protein GerW family protein [Thermotogota bacterium]
MKKGILVVLCLLLVTLVGFAESIGETTVQMLQTMMGSLDANMAIGNPVQMGPNMILPLYKADAGFGGGSGGPDDVVYGAGTGGGVNFLPFAIVVVGPEGVRTVPVYNEKPFFEQLVDGLPKLMPMIMDIVGMAMQHFQVSEVVSQPVAVQPVRLEEAPESEAMRQLKSVILVADLQNTLLEAIQEAFAYLVLDEAEEKSEFWRVGDAAEQKLWAMEGQGYLNGVAGENAELNVPIVQEAIDRMELAASAMFRDFAENGEIPLELAKQFEETVDFLTNQLEQFEEIALEKARQDPNFPEDFPLPWQVAMHLAILEADVFAAIEEAWGYMVLADPVEKEDFHVEIQDALLQLEALRALAPQLLDRIESGDPLLAAAREIADIVEGLEDACTQIFTDLEEDGQVEYAELLQFEEWVDRYTYLADLFFGKVMERLDF